MTSDLSPVHIAMGDKYMYAINTVLLNFTAESSPSTHGRGHVYESYKLAWFSRKVHRVIAFLAAGR